MSSPAAEWVFAYGSLLWNPGFHVVESRPARLDGYRRSFCMRSIHYRGTPEIPGLVLALEREAGAVCDGLVLKPDPRVADTAFAELRARELISYAYLETTVKLACTDGKEVHARTYIIDPNHDQYVKHQSLEQQAQIIAHAHGDRGSNADYVFATEHCLTQLGINDPDIRRLAGLLRGQD